ncbi:diguanylate cyclase response regulator [Solemya pervernicosa gill symbiont]|uniref:diguanylate cyclase n=2 Tax=Gammaproteobacteria incertae sedis TaxID=118884 RepID=A0A1T2L7J5_9GAMM|nr:diguanylate cyclase [Candidatus Reidiella endopervernicosa]OOZ41030.1 diguanylate cyclase response regulator [Solemya pervernicosa gill symbiont]QKQ25093.1 diguanylate cyclase [Candidatus Reidiella endopervernicosa]
MERILIVEDSKMMVQVLSHMVRKELGFEPVVTQSMADTIELMDGGDTDFLAAILDLTLPDAPRGEVIDHVLAKNIPAIVLTATFDENKREEILKKNVVDYVVKESRYSYDYVMRLIGRLDRNRRITAMVVDDSRTARGFVKSLLRQHNFNVVEASDGKQALVTLHANPNTRLVITDYNMPVMDGFELTTTIRKEFDKDAMAIIGLSGQGSPTLSAKFIKNGANDFLSKPFSHEEFYCRVMQNMEAIENVDTIKDAANRDYLTRLFNRRYFFEMGRESYHDAVNNGTPLSIAMVDIDHFKKINDGFGHDAGDVVLKRMSELLDEQFGVDQLVARFGGEEFCILFDGSELGDAENQLEAFRTLIEQTTVETEAGPVNFTISVGVTESLSDNIDAMIKVADEYLYRAKETGRNQVIGG